MRRLAAPSVCPAKGIVYHLLVAVYVFSLVLMATVPAGAKDYASSPGRSQCEALEHALAVLEWTHFLDHGPWASLFRPRRERAIQQLALRYANRCISLNQVQVLGTHNSYHIQPDPVLIDLYVLFDETAIQWEYTHRPLDEQLELLGIRQIELDVYADPIGGLYAAPLGFQFLENDFEARIPELEAPGMKVLHVQDLDYDATCWFLTECLTIVKDWSNANPRHLPIMIMIEVKDEPIPDPLEFGFVVPIEFGRAEFDDLDAEIRSVFPPEQLITPDDVRGHAPSLEQAVQTRGWPTLSEARGRVLFALDNGGSKRETYLEDHPSLMDRVLFTNSTPGQPDAAFVKVNDPLADPDRIPGLVRDGYIVRTRADANTLEARDNDTERRDEALASGAQFVSTDYREPNLAFSEYQVTLPDDAPGRCNPVNAPPGCRSFALEQLD